MLSKYSKNRKSVNEAEYCYDETMKYLKSEPKETIDERMKLNPRKSNRI